MYDTNEFRKGLKVEIDGHPYLMVENQFVKPGKGQAFVRLKLKNVRTEMARNVLAYSRGRRGRGMPPVRRRQGNRARHVAGRENETDYDRDQCGAA